MRESEDEAGMLKSRDYIQTLIQQEIDAGIPAHRIILGGFSQGGAMALLAGLTSKVKIAGIVGMSSWLVLSKKIKELVPEENPNNDTPILMCHGDSDMLVRTALGAESCKLLKAMGYTAEFKTYASVSGISPIR
jgi:predicted esterase